MAVGFERDESVPDAVARCAREQLEAAVRQLNDGVRDDPVEAVHSARKSIKKARAVLRLARGTLARDQRVAENAALRDAGRRLSGIRDADVALRTLDLLSERFVGQVPEGTFRAVREKLELERAEADGRLTGSTVIGEAADDLRAISARIDHWELHRDRWRAVEPGLGRTYRRGRKAFARVRTDPSFENLHEWRKRVKDLWYQLRLLAPVCGPAVRGQAKEADRLGELLGDDHDLGVLRQLLRGPKGDVAVDVGALVGIIDYRRSELQTEAMHVGERLYAEKPKAFLRRMHRLWKAGRAEVRDSRMQRPGELAELTRTTTAA